MDLIFPSVDWPVSSSLADHIDQFQERSLVPALSHLSNLPSFIERDEVNLK
jgi:hypothetical protein